MNRRKELNEFQRGKILALFQEKHSIRSIAKFLEIPKSTVHLTIQNFETRGSAQNKKRKGRPLILDNNNDYYLKKIVEDNPWITVDQIKEELQKKISAYQPKRFVNPYTDLIYFHIPQHENLT
jgi:transposase